MDSATGVKSLVETDTMHEQLTEEAFRDWMKGKMHDWAHDRRNELKQEFVDLEGWYADEVEKRVAEVEQALWGSVRNAEPAIILEMSRASEEALLNVLETAKSTGNVPTFELVLKTAFDRDMDAVVARALDGNEELSDLYGELIAAQEAPLIENPEERFETLAEQVPSKQDLLIKADDLLALQYGLPRRRRVASSGA